MPTEIERTDQPPRIVVTGDLVRETHLYQGKRNVASAQASSGFLVQTNRGGAELLHKLLEAAEPKVSLLGLTIDEAAPWPSHLESQAIYAPFKSGFKTDPGPPPGKKPDMVWRVTNPLGYGSSGFVPPLEPPVSLAVLPDPAPKVLLIDDGGAGFRTVRAKTRWPNLAGYRWIVLNVAHPLCEGDLWRELVKHCCQSEGASELVVIVSADELRRDGAALNRGLSWERTVSDTCETLSRHPQLSALRQAAHVLVVFRREGVLWIRRSSRFALSEERKSSSHTLIIDPSIAEGEWASALLDDGGKVYGGLTVMAAAVALQLATESTTPLTHDGFVAAMKRGVIAMRELRLRGHGLVEKSMKPQFPQAELAAIIKPKDDQPQIRQRHQPQDRFIEVPLPFESQGAPLRTNWTIAALDDGPEAPEPLYGLAFQSAVYGPSRLLDIPFARFRDLLSVDREEIETLRSLRLLIQAYEKGGPKDKPLCLGAFGPPGAGKSFGIKQIAYEVMGKDVDLPVFNLSQFSDPKDLIGAFHQVRDKVLSGRTPVVFWDEFDSQELRWLQFLLAPMQDGKFQSGQLTHLLGKCVFVFAGATSWDFEHFGPAPEPADDSEADELRRLMKDQAFAEARQRAQTDFRLKKGPDFISRLNGHINVLGPNRRLKYNFTLGQWDRIDKTDITFPVRRAILLRSFLKAKDTDPLNIDRDLLNAVLRQPRYRHGARSMEQTIEPLRGPHMELRPAQLPPPQVLAQHLDPASAFSALLTENASFLSKENASALAAAIHENYRRLFTPPDKFVADPQFREKFEALNAWGQATNLAAARRIPYVLAVAGLCVVPGHATKSELDLADERLRRFLVPLQQEEHALWMDYLISNGWLQSTIRGSAGKLIRNNSLLLHTCLLPFEDLSKDDQRKDTAAILSLPETVGMVGFKIVPFSDDDV